MAHILSMAAFFGGIGLLDLRLMGWRGTVPLRPFAEHVLPWLYATFAVAAVTGWRCSSMIPCMWAPTPISRRS